ncbi:hypothetical protein SADUNF_Sadunf06G0165100 [Salix dunnii]|uniref:Cholesterol oxidase n=1 Tax=Salix dunnii TaxID=1413687 RepID=A0A835N108_9ROSI|nr:hypothetical protein SADUNF_Sadunf06G0165100 [Salix dunnii]
MTKQAEIKLRLENRGDDYDAIVVGSGYGGSVAACRMSAAGIKVCLLEKGRRWKAEDFPTDRWKIMSAVRYENQNLGIRFGPEDALFQLHEQKDSLAAVACGLGGGSLVNAGVMLPTPIRARRNPKWPKEWERDWDICESSAAAMLRIQSSSVKFPIAKVMGQIAEGEFEESIESSVKLSVKFDVEEPPSNPPKLEQIRCTIRTKCQARYVIKNPHGTCQPGGISRKRRWRVYINEIDYITSDWVILSAGVLGTTEMLFQSQMRGLRLSDTLGSGFSCNGNTLAYVAGSAAPLKGYGLNRKQLSEIPYQDRPGPSISSSHTSSLGFTIQSAILPRAYPYLLFEGITTYTWPTGYQFFHGIVDRLKHFVGLGLSQSIILNAMGYDESNGKIMLDKDTDKICFHTPQDPLLPRKIKAFQKLTKKLGGILFMSKYRSTAVHLLGGCNASSDSSGGVCNHKGQVFDPKTPATVHAGLYVCDASLIPCSVGINPSLTIATAAEHACRYLVQDILEYKNKISPGVAAVDQNQFSVTGKNLENDNASTVLIKETMRGYVGGMPCTVHLKMKMQSQNLKSFDKRNWFIGEPHPLLRGKAGGYVVFRAIEKEKLHIIDGETDLCVVDCRTPYTQYMRYRLLVAAASGSRYILEGKKIMNPFHFALYAWRETTTLHVTFNQVAPSGSTGTVLNLKGELRVSFLELLKCFISLKGNGRGRFVHLLLQTLLRTYVLQIPRGTRENFTVTDSYDKSYPSSTVDDIRTADGFIIRCRHWRNPSLLNRDKLLGPILLLNGYSTESYWLPTEPHDLVRTLLEEGHEVWLLQTRLHPLNPANNATIEDIGKYDIPAAFGKILEVHGPSTKIHVVAHCVGGLAIHIALMGGHVSATHIASLSCTNSSMFFKLTAMATIKMWLPLVPISMAILGKNKILPLLGKLKGSPRHRLLKFIAQYLPRYERCTCMECEVFSGIFGNTFWHENISPTMHQWLNKQSSTKLPMSAFPHLRRICNSGFIVDNNGNNSFLIHPERMAISTLYISGGRNILVTPETSYLANKYMKLHQPSFRHERVVVDDFGHSDLLIGEKSHEKVFSHIISHVKLAKQQGNYLNLRKNDNKEALDWGIEQRPDDRGDDYDAIVVGSGYGGSVAACRMSTAGIKVCQLESRRWKAEDFPTDSWKMMSAVRYENRNLGIRFGPEDALFQLHEQKDSLAAVACGLGGGSLVNAGVMLPTPIRARRNPK